MYAVPMNMLQSSSCRNSKQSNLFLSGLIAPKPNTEGSEKSFAGGSLTACLRDPSPYQGTNMSTCSLTCYCLPYWKSSPEFFKKLPLGQHNCKVSNINLFVLCGGICHDFLFYYLHFVLTAEVEKDMEEK
jgi:hypothetical protein